MTQDKVKDEFIRDGMFCRAIRTRLDEASRSQCSKVLAMATSTKLAEVETHCGDDVSDGIIRLYKFL